MVVLIESERRRQSQPLSNGWLCSYDGGELEDISRCNQFGENQIFRNNISKAKKGSLACQGKVQSTKDRSVLEQIILVDE